METQTLILVGTIVGYAIGAVIGVPLGFFLADKFLKK